MKNDNIKNTMKVNSAVNWLLST